MKNMVIFSICCVEYVIFDNKKEPSKLNVDWMIYQVYDTYVKKIISVLALVLQVLCM